MRQALVRSVDDLHARGAIAFAEGPGTSSILKGGGELAERVIPTVLAYFGALPARRSPDDAPGVSLVEACFREINERLEAGRKTPHEGAWRCSRHEAYYPFQLSARIKFTPRKQPLLPLVPWMVCHSTRAPTT